MVWLRHSLRHIHRSTFDYVVDQMTALGWVGPTVPFGTLPITFMSEYPQEFDVTKARLAANRVAVTMGTEDEPEWLELGGVLAAQRMPCFADIYADSEGVAAAISTDIKDCLLGRFPGTSRRIDVMDYSQSPAVAVPGWKIEFLNVERIPVEGRPEGMTVRFVVETTFPDVYGDV